MVMGMADQLSIKFRFGTSSSYEDSVELVGHLNSLLGAWPQRFDATVEDKLCKGDGVSLAGRIPKRLKNSLVKCAGERYTQSAFTFISELFGNVMDHAKSEIPGFAALQYYRKGGKIQAVISDSGIGIVGSLQPVLELKYQELFRQLDFSKPEAGPELVLHVFKQGRISSSDDDGRGLGLKRSGDVAADFNATVTVRQKNFELTMVYSDGRFNRSYHRVDMPTILGTHICFDFLIDS